MNIKMKNFKSFSKNETSKNKKTIECLRELENRSSHIEVVRRNNKLLQQIVQTEMTTESN